MTGTIGSRIRFLREKRGFNASALAKLVNVSPTAVFNWENKNTRPEDKSINALATTLATTREYLLFGDLDQSLSQATTVTEVIQSAKARIAELIGAPTAKVSVNITVE